MKIDKPANNNYCATVVEIKNIIPLANCENVVATTIFGFTAIVSKDTKVGDIGIVFPPETKLSDTFCYNNNLYRHNNKNKDESLKGYIEDNQRVKAVKFRGNTSNCLFMGLESLGFTGIEPSLLSVGDEFDNLNGIEICRKYMVAHKTFGERKPQEKKFTRVDSKHMPEHYDSDNFFKWSSNIPQDATVIITQKLHGTSIRIGNTIAKRKLGIAERFLQKIGFKPQLYVYDYIYGSRKVIKDVNNPYQNHFYATDIWTEEGKKLVGLLPENYIVYGELIGYTAAGQPIQRDYAYSITDKKCELYIYRIAIISPGGYVTDLSWDQVKEFCKLNGLKCVVEMWRGKMSDLKIEDFIDKRFFESGYKQCLWLGDNQSLVDEGVCVRMDGIKPYIMKAKSPKFLEHETKILDTGDEDIESSQSIVESIIK